MERRLTARGEKRRQQIVDEATRLFATRGYHATAVAEVVETLGVGKGVFYWYFASKEELFTEILDSAHHDLRKRQQQAIGDEPDPVTRIELGIGASLAWFAEHRYLFDLFRSAATEDRFRPLLRRHEEVAVEDVSRHLKEAMAAGAIADAEPAMVAHALIGATRHLAHTYLRDGDRPVEAVAGVAVDFCLRGLTGS